MELFLLNLLFLRQGPLLGAPPPFHILHLRNQHHTPPASTPRPVQNLKRETARAIPTMPSTQLDASTGGNDDMRAELERQEQLDLADPLRHFLALDDDPAPTPSTSDTADVRDLPSSHDYSIVPQQIESIIDRRATIRYYRDLTRRPQLLSSDAEGTQQGGEEGTGREEGECWDVQLKLDMTTGCGGKIWPAAEVLGAYIAGKYSHPTSPTNQAVSNAGYPNHGFDWRHKRIIELGSGTGLVGYLVHALALDGCQIDVTDQDVMLPLMRENLLLNFPSTDSNTAPSESGNGFVRVAELDWATPPPALFTDPAPDVLLLADCVYLESAFQPLVDTLAALATDKTEILFCYQKRRKADKRFFGLLKKQFAFEDVADDDETRTKEYRRQGTQLLRIRKK